MKLTNSQQEALADINERGESGKYYSDGYPPVRKLVELGFIERGPGKWVNVVYRITEAGKAALEGENG